jgi:hypothetical protein
VNPDTNYAALPGQPVAADEDAEPFTIVGEADTDAFTERLAAAGPRPRRCDSGHNLAHLAAIRHATGIGTDRDPAKISRARHLHGRLGNPTVIHDDAANALAATPASSADGCLWMRRRRRVPGTLFPAVSIALVERANRVGNDAEQQPGRVPHHPP